MLSGTELAEVRDAAFVSLMTERPTHLRVVRASIPEAIDAAVAKALDKTPADRFATAAAFGAALRAEHPPEAPPRRLPVWGWLAGTAAIAAMLYLLLPRQVVHERLHKLLQPQRNLREDLRRELAFLQHRRLPRLKLPFLNDRIHAYPPAAIRGSSLNSGRC